MSRRSLTHWRFTPTCAPRQPSATSSRLIKSSPACGRKPLTRPSAPAPWPVMQSRRLDKTIFERQVDMSEVFFAASVRTPIGKFGGTLKDWAAADLGMPVVQESLRRAGLEADTID